MVAIRLPDHIPAGECPRTGKAALRDAWKYRQYTVDTLRVRPNRHSLGGIVDGLPAGGDSEILHADSSPTDYLVARYPSVHSQHGARLPPKTSFNLNWYILFSYNQKDVNRFR